MSSKDFLKSAILTLVGLNADAKAAQEDYKKLENDPNFKLTEENKDEIRALLGDLEKTLQPIVEAVSK